ncbi:MAG: hypothetical protein IJ907_03080 [Prevotella sp.]|nr:hypothetical protein [Prevotella sp.]
MKRNLLKFALCAMALLPWERGRETLISYTFTAEDASSYGNVDGATNAWVNSQGSAIGGTVSFFWKKGEGYCRDANGSKAYTFASGRATPSIKFVMALQLCSKF